jgi:hypothetical protein
MEIVPIEFQIRAYFPVNFVTDNNVIFSHHNIGMYFKPWYKGKIAFGIYRYELDKSRTAALSCKRCDKDLGTGSGYPGDAGDLLKTGIIEEEH